MAAFTEQTNNLAPGRCATALAIFAEGRERLQQAPFTIGQRVLWAAQPWLGAQIVTKLDIIRKPRNAWWSVTTIVGNLTSICPAEDLIAAPADWVDPPAAPLYSGKLDLADFGSWGEIKAHDAEFQGQLRDWRADYADWCWKHLAPLGYAQHVENAIAATMADYRPATAAE